jgi:hypothetical protein
MAPSLGAGGYRLLAQEQAENRRFSGVYKRWGM